MAKIDPFRMAGTRKQAQRSTLQHQLIQFPPIHTRKCPVSLIAPHEFPHCPDGSLDVLITDPVMGHGPEATELPT